ncbi:transcriptional regulator [Rothia sp. HMSC065C12]|uniref:transcriptional regulator n=1 Tax=Rothia sp. HMSC065C12 TaxID=1739340 RepID=UPI0008A28CC2|nr:transcriptional regulator [Rothia sp. HMSC065C12]OFJ98735.1 transcriptional regulator [Rothia sp. HMSC065C12]
MELSALGIPLEPLRYIWLIAFIVYIGLCIVPAITHPATISREKAKELYIARYGSPINNAMRYAERRSLEGNPLPKHKLRSNLTRARKEIDSVYGISSIEAWFHVLMYVWACLVARSIFRLYTDIAHNGILLPALLLPFYMVFVGARSGRRTWRKARSIDTDDMTAGLPQIYSAALMRLNLFAAPKEAHPQAKPVRAKNDFYIETHFVLVLALIVFFYSLVGWTVLGVQPMPIGGASITLAIVTTVTAVTRWVHMRRYLLFNPDSFYVGRLFLPAKKYSYPDIEEFCVFPKNPEQIKTTFYEPSQWQIEIKVPSRIPPNLAKRMPWLRRHIVAVHDERVVCLTSQVAFYLEQERWADLRSPADREKLAEYFTNGNIVCTSLGYKPVNEEPEK